MVQEISNKTNLQPKETCPLCCKNTCNITRCPGGWCSYMCDNCFNFMIGDNVKEKDVQNYKPKSAELNKELRKRCNAIYNFLLEKPYYAPKGYEDKYWEFAYYTPNTISQPFQIEMNDLLAEYPKDENEKLQRILSNLAKKFPKGKQFDFSAVDDGLMYCEEQDIRKEKEFWFTELSKKGYLNADKIDGYVTRYSVSLDGINFLKGVKMEDNQHVAPNIVVAPTISPIYNNEVNVTISIGYEQVCQAIEQSGLSEKDKAILDKMIMELNQLKDNKKDKGMIWGKMKKLLSWVTNKAVDVSLAATLIPYVATLMK